jgi:membrane-anchored protein YejM (alkaline phosphatase superfamily)
MKHYFLTPQRPALISWSFGMFFACALALLPAGAGYLFATPLPPGPLGTSYAIIAWASHMGLLAFVTWLLIVLPLTILIPVRGFIKPLTIGFAAALLSIILLDTLVYGQNRFHLSPLILQILEPRTYLFGVVYLGIFVAFFSVLSLRMKVMKLQMLRRFLMVVAVVLGQVFTHGVHIWADANYYAPITSFTAALPLFAPATAKNKMARMGLLDIEKARSMQNVAPITATQDASQLKYPRRPLVYDTAVVPYNLLIIEIDAWRFDCLNAKLTPHLDSFAALSSRFTNHYSGGNSSRAGNFSLFYGLPGTYWKYFDGLQKPPVLMDLIQKSYADIQILTSATLVRPGCMDRSIFAKIPDLRLETKGFDIPWQRDSVITAEWLSFTAARDTSKKFFGFLYYDGPTAESSPPAWQNRMFFQSGSNSKFNKYLRAANYDDSLVGTILADLSARGLLSSTVVVITADHAQEYNDSREGFTGHGSAFSRWQMQVPLIVYWPNQTAASYTHCTSHNDLVATLVTKLFGVTNDPADFCSGRSLFEKKSWDWLIGESYYNFAVLQPSQVTVSQPGGRYEIRDSLYHPLPLSRLDRTTLARAMRENGRFFGKQQ